MLVRRTERADGSTQAVGAQVGVGAANARTAVPLSAVEGEAKNVSRRVPLATNPLCRKANNASAPLKGKEGDDSNYPARSGERSEKSLPKSTLYKGGIGQQR